jgi:hypothetical protein
VDSAHRRAALIATAVTVPFVVIAALAIAAISGSGTHPSPVPRSSGPLGPVSLPAPPPNPAADTPCTSLLGKLPLTLPTGGTTLPARPAQSSWTYVAAWGDPAVTLRCGVPRPSQLTPGSSAELVVAHGVAFLPVQHGDTTVWTTVDRVVYIEVSVPRVYPQQVIAVLADAVVAAMPTAVCSTDPAEPDPDKLCTRRR